MLPQSIKSIVDRYVPQVNRAFFIAAIVGVSAGVAASVLKWLIGTISRFMTSGLVFDQANWQLLVWPLLGIVLTGIFVRYIVRVPLSHGSARVAAHIKDNDFRLPGRLTVAPMIGASITLGLGGTAGSEGPIAYTGAALGSNIGRICGVSPQLLRTLVGCGAAAGIAGIYKAPVGGMLYTLEVLGMELTTMSVMLLVVTCLTSGLMAFILSDMTLDMTFSHAAPFEMSTIPWIILLGLGCGIYSAYYAGIMNRLAAWLDGMSNQWVKNLIAGATLALAVFAFPALYGEGYGVIGQVLDGNTSALVKGSFWWGEADSGLSLMLVVLGIILVKSAATTMTNTGGGVAGNFAPTLFAGCMAGFLIVYGLNSVAGGTLPAGNFALYGMAAVMAGVIRAPFMAIFLVAEMTGCYQLLLPITVASLTSYGVRRLADRFVG